MDKIITALMGFGLLALSCNAAAIPIQYKGHQIDHEDIPMLLTDFREHAVKKKDKKRVKKAFKKHGKLVTAMDTGKKPKKVNKRTRKLEKKLARLALNLSLLDQFELPPGDVGDIPTNGNSGNGGSGTGVNGDGGSGNGGSGTGANGDGGSGNGGSGTGANGDGGSSNGGGGNGSVSVPEPSIIALLGLGLVGIGAVRGLKRTR